MWPAIEKVMDNPKSIWIGIVLSLAFTLNQTQDRYTNSEAQVDREQTAIVVQAVQFLLTENKDNKFEWEKYLIRLDGYMESMVESHKDSDKKIDKLLERLPINQVRG